MSHLHRELAPISDKAWAEIDKEVTRTLRTFLAARQIVDFSGPHGLDYSADSLGRLERLPGPVDGVEAGIRVVQPLVELRHRFTMDRADIEDIDAIWLEEPEAPPGASGARGIGEIGIVGAAAAIANAAYHATGVRVRNLPLTPDTLMS